MTIPAILAIPIRAVFLLGFLIYAVAILTAAPFVWAYGVLTER